MISLYGDLCDISARIFAQSVNKYEQGVAHVQTWFEAVQESVRIRLLMWLRVDEIVDSRVPA